MTTKQQVMTGVIPPLSALQEAAALYINTEQEAKDIKARADKRKDEMIALANKINAEFVKVRDDEGFLHTFSFESKASVRHTKLLDVKIVKHDENSAEE